MRTLRITEYENMVWVEVETADGAVGVGEACLGPLAIEEYLHEVAAPYLLGRGGLDIERHDRALRGYLGYDGAGVETRGNGAINLALWDLFGQVTGRPVYELLGGRSRDRIRAYNTCAGYDYARSGGHLELGDQGVGASRQTGPYDDLFATFDHPEGLAEDLLAQGITAMKIWPFDGAAAATHGREIDAASLAAGLEPLRRIRAAVGNRIDVMIELHGQWQPGPMRTIIEALEELGPFWLEDPIKATSPGDLAALAAMTSIPIAVSETVAGRPRFRELLDAGAVDVLIFDVGWTGGITEARKIADLADAYEIPVAPHDCTGPLLLAASAHLSIHLPNALVQEHVRAFVHGWYADVATGLPAITDGFMDAPAGPGLGTRLRPDAWTRSDATVRESTSR
ncbi:MAG TPA: mandelate racemase/muconate lactonizing enzyme family protein [Candidatus Limnocylindrales bacterium]